LETWMRRILLSRTQEGKMTFFARPQNIIYLLEFF
jgi:hypothetical protein